MNIYIKPPIPSVNGISLASYALQAQAASLVSAACSYQSLSIRVMEVVDASLASMPCICESRLTGVLEAATFESDT